MRTQSWFDHLSIKRRLALEYGSVLLLSVLMGGFLLVRLGAMEADWAEFEQVTAARNAHATAGVEALSNAIHHFKNFILRGGDYPKKFEADLQALEGAVASYRATGPLSEKEEASLAAMSKGAATYRQAMASLVERRAQGASIEALDKAVAGADKPIAAALDQLLEVARERTHQVSARIRGRLSSSRAIGVGLMGLLVVLGAVIARRSTRSIVEPLGQAVSVARRVASGDLSARAEARSNDETGQLLKALGEMNHALSLIVGQVRAASQTVEASARGIATGNADLAARTGEQATNLEETASSMEELTATVQQTAANAKHAVELASRATDEAKGGERVMNQAVAAMVAVNKTSTKIADIIGIIDEVAFQTGILALNASVEAARAGEHGRGFAVVAAEVRGLSERTTASAKEINALITESADGVQKGLGEITEAGQAMSRLLGSLTQVAGLINQIASASGEQSLAIEQVNSAIMRIQQVTQQNTSLVERSAANAEELDAQATSLSQVVSRFTLAHDAAEGSSASPFSATQADVPQATSVLEPALAAHRPDASGRRAAARLV